MGSSVDLRDLAADTEKFAQAIPLCRFLGLAVDRHQDGLHVVMPFSEKLIGNPAIPALHGGSIGALLETCSIVALVDELKSRAVPKTIDITVNYLRSAGPVDTFAQCQIIRVGRRIANTKAVAWQADKQKPVAMAYGHFLVASDA